MAPPIIFQCETLADDGTCKAFLVTVRLLDIKTVTFTKTAMIGFFFVVVVFM